MGESSQVSSALEDDDDDNFVDKSAPVTADSAARPTAAAPSRTVRTAPAGRVIITLAGGRPTISLSRLLTTPRARRQFTDLILRSRSRRPSAPSAAAAAAAVDSEAGAASPAAGKVVDGDGFLRRLRAEPELLSRAYLCLCRPATAQGVLQGANADICAGDDGRARAAPVVDDNRDEMSESQLTSVDQRSK
jgi:hypothetical protein